MLTLSLNTSLPTNGVTAAGAAEAARGRRVRVPVAVTSLGTSTRSSGLLQKTHWTLRICCARGGRIWEGHG